jgi:hypothetical protein
MNHHDRVKGPWHAATGLKARRGRLLMPVHRVLSERRFTVLERFGGVEAQHNFPLRHDRHNRNHRTSSQAEKKMEVRELTADERR